MWLCHTLTLQVCFFFFSHEKKKKAQYLYYQHNFFQCNFLRWTFTLNGEFEALWKNNQFHMMQKYKQRQRFSYPQDTFYSLCGRDCAPGASLPVNTRVRSGKKKRVDSNFHVCKVWAASKSRLIKQRWSLPVENWQPAGQITSRPNIKSQNAAQVPS